MVALETEKVSAVPKKFVSSCFEQWTSCHAYRIKESTTSESSEDSTMVMAAPNKSADTGSRKFQCETSDDSSDGESTKAAPELVTIDDDDDMVKFLFVFLYRGRKRLLNLGKRGLDRFWSVWSVQSSHLMFLTLNCLLKFWEVLSLHPTNTIRQLHVSENTISGHQHGWVGVRSSGESLSIHPSTLQGQRMETLSSL